MMRTGAIVVLALTCLCSGAFGYSFWGITMGTSSYQNMNQLTFSGVGASGAQYAVGGYKYTQVDNAWYGPYKAADPGEAYAVHRKMDAQAIFFMSDATTAHFVIISSVPRTGVSAPECGYGNRLFGPGDLRIAVNGNDYGVGVRLDNLLWAVDPKTTNDYYKIHKSQGGTDDIHARDAGTAGRVEKNPQWDHVDNPTLPDNTDRSHAFFVKDSGTLTGNATIGYTDTGANLYGAEVYAYSIDVPWSALQLDPGQYDFLATWGPDCGNDQIAGRFTGGPMQAVPEPGSIVSLLSFFAALVGLTAYRKRYASPTRN